MASTHGKRQSEADANKTCSPGLSPTSFPGLYLPSHSFPWRLRVLLLCPATSPHICCSFVKSSKCPSESPGTDALCFRDARAVNFCLSFINLWPMKFAGPQPIKWRWVEEYSHPPTPMKSSESIELLSALEECRKHPFPSAELRVHLFQERRPLPGPESGLFSNRNKLSKETHSWQSKRLYWEGCRAQGESGSPGGLLCHEACGHGFYGDGVSFQVASGQSSCVAHIWFGSGSFPVADVLTKKKKKKKKIGTS